MLANMTVSEPNFIQKIKDSQLQDPDLAKIVEHILERLDFRIVDGVLYFHDRLCVPNVDDLKNEMSSASSALLKRFFYQKPINMAPNSF